MYQYLIGPMLHQPLKKIEAMGGETVQPLATIVIGISWQSGTQAFPSQLQGTGIIKDCC